MPVDLQPHFTANGQVVSNPAILGGTPVFAGARVPVSSLFEYLADGLDLDYFLESFPTVERHQTVAVLRFAQQCLDRSIELDSTSTQNI
jgi:uncharacterized protein (DUF433 family)